MDRDLSSYITKLVSLDKLYDWGNSIPEITGDDRKKVFSEATPLWVKRMIKEGKLLLHPEIIEELRIHEWFPTELHKKMIWSSIVCQLDGKEQKTEKARIRKIIQEKYNNDWWEDVYNRAGLVWPAWDRFRKNVLSVGSGTHMLAIHSSVVRYAMQDEFNEVLKMVPKS